MLRLPGKSTAARRFLHFNDLAGACHLTASWKKPICLSVVELGTLDASAFLRYFLALPAGPRVPQGKTIDTKESEWTPKVY